MKYVQQKITDFLYNNITQDFLDWDESTTYIYEDYPSLTDSSTVRYGGYYWRSVTDGNIGNNPEDSENIHWVKWSSSNTYSLIDQKSLSSTSITYVEADADYLSTDTATDIALDSLVWDTVGLKMYKALVSTNDLPNTDFSDDTLWENKSDIIVEFVRGNMDTLGFGYLTTSGITIEHFTQAGDLVPEASQTLTFSVNEEVYDLWDYIYSDYTDEIDRGIKVDLYPIGYKIRVTISRLANVNKAACGFMIGGDAVYMGDTLDRVPFNFTSFSVSEIDSFGNLNIVKRNIQDLVDFETIIDKTFVPRARRNIKSIYDDIILFIVDEATDSFLENALTLGKIQDASVVGEVKTKNIITWSIMESI